MSQPKLVWYGVVQGELCDLNTYIKAERSNRQWAAQIKSDETTRCAQEFTYTNRKEKLEPIANFPVELRFRWFTKDAKKDCDNVTFAKKFIADGMVQAGVVPNDSRRYITLMTDIEMAVDKTQPRVVVEAWSLLQ